MNDNTSDKTVDKTDKVIEYKPTKKEMAVIEQLMNPKNAYVANAVICEKAGVSERQFYRMIKKEAFMTFYKDFANDLVKSSVGKIINTFVSEAVNGSFNHGKTILEMAGMVQNDRFVHHTGNVSSTVQFLDDFGEEGETDEWNSED